MKGKDKNRRLTSAAPMTGDQLLRLENVVKRQPVPKELQNLKSANSFASAGQVSLEKMKLPAGSGLQAYHLGGGQKVMRGLPLTEFIRLKRSEIKVASPTLPLPPPRIPDWADVIYHPKMSPRIARRTMRRANGNRVKPLWLFTGNRQAFFPSGYPLQCIGKIFAWNDPYSFNWSWTASGVLVGRNIVLTASHAVPWGANPAMMQFVPAYYNGTSTLGPDVASFVDATSAYYQEPDPNVDRPAWDYAVLRLIDPLGDSLGWFGYKTYDDHWNDGNYWTLVGYPGDIAGGEQPSSQSGISFHDDDSDGDALELETDNGDATPGDSGGPFFGWWDGEFWPSVVGVCSAQEQEWPFPWFTGPEDNNVAGAGSPMADLIQWARNNWS
jgi:hypothetical protein